jgi:hypothetical protein
VQLKWETDPEAPFREDPRSPLEQCEDDWDSPFESFGWAAQVVPDFENIQKLAGKLKKERYLRRRAPDAFMAAFMKLSNELARRDPDFNLEKMPGKKSDLLELAIKFDAALDHTLSTFDTYLKGLCKFKKGARPSNYYRLKFPEYFTSN